MRQNVPLRVFLVVAVLTLLALAGACRKAPQQPSGPFPVSGHIVANGVRLHYLDFGGNGKPMLLLPGFGNDAHVFDTFAPRFTGSFHVYSLTRRGFGKSDKPAGGYDMATRVEDIRELLDELEIDRVNLVGHSMAGDELTLFATRYPQRVEKLVYLDAAFNRYRMMAAFSSDPAMPPLQKRLSLEATGSPEASTIVVDDLPPAGERRVLVAYMRAMDGYQPDYRPVNAPALALYAGIPPNHPRSAHESSLARRIELNTWWVENAVPRFEASREQFRRQMRHGVIVELPDAGHHLFRGRSQDQVAEKTRAFLLQ